MSRSTHTCQTLAVMLHRRTVGPVRGASHFGPADWSLHHLTRKGDNQDMASSLTSGTPYAVNRTPPKPGLWAPRSARVPRSIPKRKRPLNQPRRVRYRPSGWSR